jgi:hypothetical protein
MKDHHTNIDETKIIHWGVVSGNPELFSEWSNQGTNLKQWKKFYLHALPKCWDWEGLCLTEQSKTLSNRFDKPAALGITRKCGCFGTNWFYTIELEWYNVFKTYFLPKCWDRKTLGLTKQTETLPRQFDKPAALGITRKCGRLCTNWFCYWD